MKHILNSLFVVGFLLFLLFEAFCASKLIWHYDWSEYEENCLRIFVCVTIGFDFLIISLMRLAKVTSLNFSCFFLKLEICIVLICLAILLFALVDGTLELIRAAEMFVIKFPVVITKAIGLLEQRKYDRI